MANKETPRSINLLNPVNAPEDIWETVYNWLFNVGKYLLISVEIVVLVVFFARFIVDRRNNDLTEEINDQVDLLSQPFYRDSEIFFRNLHTIFGDISIIEEDQALNSEIVSSMLEGIPSDITLVRFSYTFDRVNMAFEADNFEAIQRFEASLKDNPYYQDVRVSLSKTGDTSSKITFNVTFNLDSGDEITEENN